MPRSKSLVLITLLLNAFTCLTSCYGQSKSHNEKQSSIVSIGETVSRMGTSLPVILQDKNNDYWFGGNGVYKYDGKSIVHFTVKDGLCSNAIIGIQEDNNGNMYFDTPEGVSKFDGLQFTTLDVIEKNSSKNQWKLEPDDLWFKMGWNRSGPFRYDGKFLYYLEFPKNNQEIEFYSKYPNASYNPYGIYSLYKDSRGIVWFGTASLGVCRYDGKSFSWLYEKHLTETPNGGDFGIRSIIEDGDGHFWFCNTRYRYDIYSVDSVKNGTGRMSYRKIKGADILNGSNEKSFPYFMSIVKDNNDDLWMATYDEGVWRYDGERLTQYPVKENNEIVNLFSIYKDNQGIIWLGTHNSGAYKFNGSSFEKFLPQYQRE